MSDQEMALLIEQAKRDAEAEGRELSPVDVARIIEGWRAS